MKIKNLLFTLLIVFGACQFSEAQKDLFQETKDNIGEYFKSSEDIYEEYFEVRYGNHTRSEKVIVNSVVLHGTDFVNQLHRSGSVVFSGGAVEYLNKIKSYLLEDYKDLNDMIEVFITIDAAPNAFATVNNHIYVNTGLLELMENEAQLAYVLSHEIMHLVNEHLINKSLTDNLGDQTLSAKDVALKNKLEEVSKHNLSQLFEFESDIDGFTLFNMTDYDNQESINSLLALKHYGSTSKGRVVDSSFFSISKVMYDSVQVSMRNHKSKEDEKESAGTIYRTHPEINERIDTLTYLAKSGESKSKKYLISEDTFKKVKDHAIELNITTLARDKDFANLFIEERLRKADRGSLNENDINLLCYSLQGLVFDKLKDTKYNLKYGRNNIDSTLIEYYNTASKGEVVKWATDQLDALADKFDTKNYKTAVQSFAIEHMEKDDAQTLFGDEYASVKKKHDELYEDKLLISDIPFALSPYSDMSSRKAKQFNISKRTERPTDEKIILANSNFASIKSHKLSMSAEYDPYRSSKLYERLTDVFDNIEEDHKNVMNVIPNPDKYSSEELTDYKTINNWLNEEIYYEQGYYQSYQKKELDEIRDRLEARYAMFTLNFEIKSFSMKSFIAVYFSPFLLPHYIPQCVAYIINSSARSYNLTLIFDLESGGIAYWDKRTYLEPNSVGQLNQVYDDILKQFYEK